MNISKEAIEAAAERLHFWRGHVVEWKSMHEAAKDGWRAEARAALEAAWAVMHPVVAEDEIARDLDSRIPNDAPLWLERQVADRRAIADTVRHFARGGHGSTE